ncbi:hypothetical protein BDV95DRAFT_666004 [Massariosphaeria phaeospora]|uniref:Uncharacterized protein n=1 Tax=Massariosphaeria phaeospora TaxID=100035 RepID=A0A7C8MB25_9PLEO|nr:hypothetical protein BDV95DRAFT_666004 [Massariosphaeria phaeospora]
MANIGPDQSYLRSQYTPCNGNSCYHDLQCGHRVRTTYNDNCGSNCVSELPKYRKANTTRRYVLGRPFVCTECLVAQVKAELVKDKATNLDTSDASTKATDDDKLFHAMVERWILLLKDNQVRASDRAAKVEPMLQFFADFPEAQGDLFAPPSPGRKLKRPSGRTPARNLHRKKARTNDKKGKEKAPEMDDLAGHLADTKVGLEKENEAMRIVREVLGALALDGKGGKKIGDREKG